MTHRKMTIIEQELMLEITKYFRQEYKNTLAATKLISRKTDIPTETIKRWHKGRNPPRSGHLVILARQYADVLKIILRQTGHGYLIPYISAPDHEREMARISVLPDDDFAENVPINVPLKSWPDDINERQKWFLVELHRNIRVTATDIMQRWSVTDKTAKRDIADLKERSLIVYMGARKTGWYMLVE